MIQIICIMVSRILCGCEFQQCSRSQRAVRSPRYRLRRRIRAGLGWPSGKKPHSGARRIIAERRAMSLLASYGAWEPTSRYN